MCRVGYNEFFYGWGSTPKFIASHFFCKRICSWPMWVGIPPPISMQARYVQSIGIIYGMCTSCELKNTNGHEQRFWCSDCLLPDVSWFIVQLVLNWDFQTSECKLELQVFTPEQTNLLCFVATWCLDFVEPWLRMLQVCAIHFMVKIN